jgi:hypothetical protein
MKARLQQQMQIKNRVKVKSDRLHGDWVTLFLFSTMADKMILAGIVSVSNEGMSPWNYCHLKVIHGPGPPC